MENRDFKEGLLKDNYSFLQVYARSLRELKFMN